MEGFGIILILVGLMIMELGIIPQFLINLAWRGRRLLLPGRTIFVIIEKSSSSEKDLVKSVQGAVVCAPPWKFSVETAMNDEYALWIPGVFLLRVGQIILGIGAIVTMATICSG
ncbi:MAG: hypothetical protein ACPLKP_00740 [Microgenomates group bacterium]